ncbi:hypothetical protein [Microcella frigidaquae]|uniref:DNA helicase n=1 Tax=Microcella frigidaquae TaxID=424758 RepID=A0A840XA94_9MICO|nr:hypothetical protein [Microcella frigidaquae]MBB5617985.1 hypothetical protein [Microcella frigidaquae]NHN44302.1 hypothetical protein [Microcella frigidaquae]
MELSRKRQRELKKLRREAENVWDEQREVLERAAGILRDASRQAASVARDDVAPRVRQTYEKRIVPGVEAGVDSVRHAASATRDRFVDDVLPAVTGAIGSAIAVLDVARDKRIRDALRQVSSTGRELATRGSQRVGIVEVKSQPGPGRYILIGLGVVATAAIAYAAWQTLRTDDDLWVEEEIAAPEA